MSSLLAARFSAIFTSKPQCQQQFIHLVGQRLHLRLSGWITHHVAPEGPRHRLPRSVLSAFITSRDANGEAQGIADHRQAHARRLTR